MYIAYDFRILRMKEGSGTWLQDNRAVGNSRLAHTDVLSVSCKQVPEPSPGIAMKLQNQSNGQSLSVQVRGFFLP
jgi:hypothetical protein